MNRLELLRNYRIMDELFFVSKDRRDEEFEKMRSEGMVVSKTTVRNQQLHSEYIEDAKDEGMVFETGFGNLDYLRWWSKLYAIEIWEK